MKSVPAVERDTKENLERRREFLRINGRFDFERLVYLDESGITTTMTRLYGCALAGQRIHEATPQSHWTAVTLIGASRVSGMVAPMTVEAARDDDVFLAYVEHFHCTAPRPGAFVVMDNLSAHKVDGVRQLIEMAGAELVYLPPYSPDLNPIEKAWSKIKQIFRAAKARTAESLDQTIAAALRHITADNANGWFRLCTAGLQ
jgi:transposase